jgi:DNA-binding MarR family transcriptional regulator
MSNLVELISSWEKFSAKTQHASVSAFCSYYLLEKKKKPKPKGELFQGMAPPDSLTTLSKLIRRVADIHAAYSKMALSEIEGFDPEWFWFMNAIAHQKEARKSDIINFNFHQQSTGTDIINRLLKKGYIRERSDPKDKRAKLISLTPKGEKINKKTCKLMYLPCLLLFDKMKEEEKQLIITLLSDIEINHTRQFPDYKVQNIIELSEAVVGTEKVRSILNES